MIHVHLLFKNLLMYFFDNDNSFYFQIHNDTYNITFVSYIASELGNKEKVEV